jgi:hypothetical protein
MTDNAIVDWMLIALCAIGGAGVAVALAGLVVGFQTKIKDSPRTFILSLGVGAIIGACVAMHIIATSP